jgi:UDP-N-acetylmuramate dehydrogenase
LIELPGYKGKIYNNYPLSKHTTWKIGGCADIFLIPNDLEDLNQILFFVRRKGIPLFVLGQGSNVLIDDEGLPGITLQLGKGFNYQYIENDLLIVGAKTQMPRIAKIAAMEGFSGFEFLIGIPGTIGAGVVINAGKGTDDDTNINSVLKSVSFINKDLELISKNTQQLNMNYRHSNLNNDGALVIETVFGLQNKQTPADIISTHKTILAERKEKFPLNFPNAGSVFKRPKGFPPAGWLIEKAGLKGVERGNAQVSHKHANFIINKGNATSRDVKSLIEVIIEKVYQTHGVFLEKEIIFMPETSTWN